MKRFAVTISFILLLLLLPLSGGCGRQTAPARVASHTSPSSGAQVSPAGGDSHSLSEPNGPEPAYLQPFQDPVFGSTVERISDARAWGVDYVVNEYSKADPWNCDGTRLILTDSKGRWLLLDGRSYQRNGFVKARDGEPLVASIEPRWHPTDPDAFYYFDGNSLMRYSCRADKGSVVHTWKQYVAVSATGEGNLSLDGKKLAIAGHGGKEGTPQDVFIYYLDEDRTGLTKSVSAAPEGIDWVSVTPNGDYAMILWGTTGGGAYQGGELFDLDWKRVGRVTKGCHHGDFALEPGGHQVFVMAGANDPDLENAPTGTIIRYDIPECTAKPILQVDWYNGLHISGRCTAKPGWVVVSTFHEWSEEGGGPTHGDPEGDWDPYENEVFALAIDGSGTVRRLAHDHAEKRLYFEEPHAVANRDLSKVAFSSNWGKDIGKQKVDAYVITPQPF